MTARQPDIPLTAMKPQQLNIPPSTMESRRLTAPLTAMQSRQLEISLLEYRQPRIPRQFNTPFTESELHPVEIKLNPRPGSTVLPPSILPPRQPDLPNGGFRAWLQVGGAFVLFFNTWGLMNTFGVYQAYYESGKLFVASSSNISWIGSIQAFLMFLMSGLTGPLFDAGYLRLLLICGTCGVVVGHMMLSLVHEYWQALLAQAFTIGLGAGALFMPSVAVVPQYFNRRLATAMGITVSGSSLGGIVYPIMFSRLVKEIGFPWAVRAIGLLALVLLMIPVLTMRLRVKPAKRQFRFDMGIFTEARTLTFILSGFFGYLGLQIPFFYISFTVSARGYASAEESFYILAILNAASIFGRVVPGMLADRVGALNMLIPTAAGSAVIAFAIIGAKSFASMVVLAVLYGFWSGTYIALPSTVFISLTPSEKRDLIGIRMGIGFTLMGLGTLTGSPVAGAILGSNKNFTGVYLWCGSALTAACLGFCVVRYMLAGVKIAKV